MKDKSKAAAVAEVDRLRAAEKIELNDALQKVGLKRSAYYHFKRSGVDEPIKKQKVLDIPISKMFQGSGRVTLRGTPRELAQFLTAMAEEMKS